MRRVVKSVVGLAVALLAGGPVAAEPALAPLSPVEIYAGVHGGFGRGDLSSDVLDLEGAVGGGQVGVNVWLGAVMLGAEADLSASAIDGALQDVDLVTFNVGAEIDSLASLRGRLGFLICDRLSVFGTAGYAWSEVTASLSSPELDIDLKESIDYEGAVYGGGFDYRLTDATSLRLEGLRYDLEAQSSGNSDIEVDVLRAAFNYRLR